MKFSDKVVSVLLKIFPSRPNGGGAKLVTWMVQRLIGYRKKVITDNLHRSFPMLDEMQVNVLKDKYYHVLTRYLLESIHGLNMSLEAMKSKVQMKDVKVEMGEGKLILGSHYGNWEWTAVVLPQLLGKEVIAAYKPLSNKMLDRYMKRRRSRFGLVLTPMGEIIKHMSKNKGQSHYLLINDQSPPKEAKNGQFFDFLNQKTFFYDSVEKLMKKYHLEPVYLKTVVTQEGYELSIEKMDQNNVLKDFVEKLERDILEAPEYWLWSHNRWKHKM